MEIDFLPFSAFVLITTFTPGPNNITSASMSVVYGFKKTLPFMLGISVGFYALQLICAGLSSGLAYFLPRTMPVFRILGALYILYLAYATSNAGYTVQKNHRPKIGFIKGFILQAVNPKGVLYGLTLYTVFLKGMLHSPVALVFTAIVLSVVAFSAVSAWAMFGALIHTHLHSSRKKIAVNRMLALLLVYTALEIAGVFEISIV